MAKGKGTSSTSNPNIEWVTLISKDNYQFVIDKRFALRSIFIRSMLGESRTSNMARRGQIASKVNTANATASELLEIVPNGASTEVDHTSNLDSMNGRATPPPQGSNSTNTNGADPDGYVNPFAASNGADDEDSDDAGIPFEDGFAEAQSNIVKFPNIRGIILEKVVEYLCWNARYFNAKDVDIPDFKHRIKPEIAIELLMAADYLDED